MKRPNKRVRLSRLASIDALDERITKLQQYPEFRPLRKLWRDLVVTALRACLTRDELKERMAAYEQGRSNVLYDLELQKKLFSVRLALARQDYRFTAEFLERAIRDAEAQGLTDASPPAVS